jgi:hypothetical protein
MPPDDKPPATRRFPVGREDGPSLLSTSSNADRGRRRQVPAGDAGPVPLLLGTQLCPEKPNRLGNGGQMHNARRASN